MMKFSILEFLINEDIPAQLKKSAALNQKFIKQRITGRSISLLNMNLELLSEVRKLPNDDAIRITIRSVQYSVIAMLDKLVKSYRNS
jgi:hypothetical protein